MEVGEYTSDFVCTKADGDLMVRECVFRKFLMKPLTVKLLDASRDYWLPKSIPQKRSQLNFGELGFAFLGKRNRSKPLIARVSSLS